MDKCSKCKVKYPEGYTAPMFTNEGIQKDLCGICALEESNAALGIKRKSFSGETAEAMRIDAIEYRNKIGVEL
jgi:uncharacterized protein CbrC (UPF0167 family)